MRTEDPEDGRREEVIERGDRPVLVPRPPLVAAQDVGQRVGMLGDAQRVREVRVLVRVEERLVGPEHEEEARRQGQREHREEGHARGAR